MDDVCQLLGDDGRGDEDSVGNLGAGHHRNLLHTRPANRDRCKCSPFEVLDIVLRGSAHPLTDMAPHPSTVVPGVLEGGPGGEPADGRGPEQTLFEHRRVVRDEFNVLDALPVPDGAAQHHHRPSDVY